MYFKQNTVCVKEKTAFEFRLSLVGSDIFFLKQKTAYELGVRLVGSEMCIRDRSSRDCAGK